MSLPFPHPQPGEAVRFVGAYGVSEVGTVVSQGSRGHVSVRVLRRIHGSLEPVDVSINQTFITEIWPLPCPKLPTEES